MSRAFLFWFVILVLMVEVLGLVGVRLMSDQTTSLKRIADTAVIAGPAGDRGVKGATGASAFPFMVHVAGRVCTVTNLWREGTLATYENRRLTYPAVAAPFFCK